MLPDLPRAVLGFVGVHLGLRAEVAHVERRRDQGDVEGARRRAELLAKVLQKLVRAGLLESHHGIKGGYGLAKPAASLTVADVIQAVDGPFTVTACSDTDHSCEQYAKCNIRDPLWRIKDRIVSALGATSVADLAADMAPRPVPVASPVAVLRK